ncbi:MAG TPA: hypothetical protein VGN17_01755 [Bryobacteraceae bacterium]
MTNLRVRQLNSGEVRAGGRYVLYWALANRRAEWNQALEFAVELANGLGLPVLFYEGLTCTYPQANDRLHTFVLEGVAETERAAKARGMGYCFHLHRRAADRHDALYRLAADAAAVVTDDFPAFVVPGYNERAAGKVGCACYAVDASCVVPMTAIGRQEWAARTIRPKILRALPGNLGTIKGLKVGRRWTGGLGEGLHSEVTEGNVAELVASCDIDHSVAVSRVFRGGRVEALRRLRHFIGNGLKNYAEASKEPAKRATSQLSPYLHFGHISSMEVALAADGQEGFLEQLIVRRELAFNFARYGPRPDSVEALPNWARMTLAKHEGDEREPVYSFGEFLRAETHDELWNATQRELLRDGVIQGYYRMYWGKKIIEWSATPQRALETMISLHDRFALDGRDPNTYTNILWCLGLHDRPWGERAIFGTVRYMGLEGMKRKTDVKSYLLQNA